MFGSASDTPCSEQAKVAVTRLRVRNRLFGMRIVTASHGLPFAASTAGTRHAAQSSGLHVAEPVWRAARHSWTFLPLAKSS